MLTITYFLNGEEKSFEASLPYSFIGVYEGVPTYLCKTYQEFISYGVKNKRSLKLIPCSVSGNDVYKKLSYSIEDYDPDFHKDFEWIEPEVSVRVQSDSEAPKVKGKKRSKLREKKYKKK